jgi:hypothetical protein
MHQLARRVFLLFICAAACCGLVSAQTPQTITVRMIDGHSGILISSTTFLVRVNHDPAEHGDWIKTNEDGTGTLTLPANAEVISIHASYDRATSIYANCDVDKDRGSAERAAKVEHWYPVAAILSTGVVAPNDCVGKKVPEKLQVVAKPGEFVFFVRPLNTRELFKE